jgi:hypothetical protein
MTSRALDLDLPRCDAEDAGWLCTREIDHEGDHEAGIVSVKVASWPRA